MTLISPRSSNYERLEGGHGPSRTSKTLFGWKKKLILAAVLVLVLFLWWTRSRTQSGSHRGNGDEAVMTNPYNPPPAPTPTRNVGIPPVHDDDMAAKPPPPLSSAPPTSFATDPDPSKTVHCTTPSDPSLPLVQFALMIDAGSTGSRIHIYKFNNCGSSPSYEYEVFKKTMPGLSAFADRPIDAARSLDGLLDEAVKVVPEAMWKCTPVAVKATAGLRLLGAEKSEKILKEVEKRLRERFAFRVPDKDGVVIMDGKDEGVYAWITANYLLNTIRHDTTTTTSSSSYAVLDLGGASTQIVFEPSFSKPDSSLVEGEHKYDLAFAGKTYVLYQHSYLGYGLMRARQSIHRLVEFMDSLRGSGGSGNGGHTGTPGVGGVSVEGIGQVIGNPCLAKGTRRVVDVEDERTGEKRKVVMAGEDIGSFEACNRIVELVLAKDAICEVKPCSFDGVYQPSLMDTFASGKILLLSYFYDRLYPLLPKAGSTTTTTDGGAAAAKEPTINVASFASMAVDVCKGKDTWEKRWGNDQDVMHELEGRPEWCLDLTFMHALLRLGYEFADEREVKIGKQIDATELGWALGATLAMVAGEVKCRI